MPPHARARRPLGGPPAASGPVRALGVLAVVNLAWFLANVAHPLGPRVSLWIATPVSAALATVVLGRTARATFLRVPTRRFWDHLALAGVLVGIASLSQAIDVLRHPTVGGAHNGSLLLTVDSLAVVVIIYALYRLPLGTFSRNQQLRVLLDAGTVMAGAAVFIWHWSTRPALGVADTAQVVGSLVLAVLALVVVLAVVKVALAGYAFVDRSALRWLAFAIFIGVAIPFLQPLIGRPYLLATQVSVPVVFLCAAWAAERQLAAGADRCVDGAEPARAFSFLPYGAVAAVDALLVLVTWDGRTDARVVAAGAVALTAIVVVRQLTAFRENGRLLARLDHGATHDALTELPNRVLFGMRLTRALAASDGRAVAVALIDLDDFKEVNDRLGHEVGDLLLIAVAQRLRACMRTGDTVARLGGDEFVVVLDGADPAAADTAARRMIEALRRPAQVAGHELPIRASIGIADGRTGDESSLLLRHADIAMYEAKKVPGTAYLHYAPSMTETGTDHTRLAAELRTALADEQFVLWYQPIVSLDDGGVVGAEALVRWVHPTRGMVPPDLFIPVAERTGLMVPLGRWVLREACRQLAAWNAGDATRGAFVLSVNVSARELREADFASSVAATMAEFGIDARQIVLEVTETAALEVDSSSRTLSRLHELGVRVSLDDFGTGNSTLSLLQDCPVDEIKLDRSFTQALLDGRVPMAAVVIHLARAMGLHAVAEGVETPEQAERLRAMGYVAAQGYLFGRPMPALDLGTWMSRDVVRPAA